jgi:heme A synthase
MATPIEKRQRRVGLMMAGGLLVLGTALGALLNRSGLPPMVTFVVLLATLLAATAATLLAATAATLPWWRLLDHMQRDAQYVSWYWGGTVGAITALAALFAFTGADSAMTRGAIVLMVGQAIGFGVFWLGWRLRFGGTER